MSQLRPPVNSRDHISGDPSAPVLLVEFGDYECRFCGEAYVVVKALERTLGDRLCFVFRNFPLTDRHEHALFAAEAAEAAATQGMFWAMHDMLFTHQDALALRDLEQYASRLGLDMQEFERDLQTRVHLDKVHANVISGALSDVPGTPTFFINGLRHDGPFDFDSIGAAIASAANAALVG